MSQAVVPNVKKYDKIYVQLFRHSNGISHNWTRIHYANNNNIEPTTKNGMQRENIWLFKCVFIYKFSKPLFRFIIILCAFQESPCLSYTIFPVFFLPRYY